MQQQQQPLDSPRPIDEARYEAAVRRLYLAALKKGLELEAEEAKIASVEETDAPTSISTLGATRSDRAA